MLALVLFLFGVVFMPIIAVLFLIYIVLGKLSYTWFLEVFVNDVAEAGIPAPQATVKKVLMFHRPSNQSHENVDLLRPEIDHPHTCRFVAEARGSFTRRRRKPRLSSRGGMRTGVLRSLREGGHASADSAEDTKGPRL